MSVSGRLELFDAVLVLSSGFIFALKTLPDLTVAQDTALRLTEDSIILFFGLEFVARWYAAGLVPKFLTKPINIIRLLSFLPFTVLLYQKYVVGDATVDPFEASIYSTLSLLTVLRLQNFVKDIESFEGFYRTLGIITYAKEWQLDLARVLISVISLVSISAGLFYEVEHKVNPTIPDAFTALYFSIETITTVGFGDVTFVTLPGRLVLCAYLLGGATILPFQLAKLGESLLDDDRRNAPTLQYKSSPSIFRRYDQNADGVLEEFEMAELFKDAKMEDDSKEIYQAMDADGSGAIDIFEFDRNLPMAVRERLESERIDNLPASLSDTVKTLDGAFDDGRKRVATSELARPAIRTGVGGNAVGSSLLKTYACGTCGEELHLTAAKYCCFCGAALE